MPYTPESPSTGQVHLDGAVGIAGGLVHGSRGFEDLTGRGGGGAGSVCVENMTQGACGVYSLSLSLCACVCDAALPFAATFDHACPQK